MAGKKETPRQKMIGMMYIVLTALLALQVSNAVLEKFAIINVTLNGLITEGNSESERVLQQIITDAGESQDAGVLKAKENASKVRDLTKSTIKAIEDLKVEMMKKSGTTEINERLINDHSSKVAAMMIDSKSTVGKNYENLLNEYVKQLNALTSMDPPFTKIAKAPKEIPIFASDDDHVRKDFLTFTFENTPVIAALASVTQAETEILDYIEDKRVLELACADAYGRQGVHRLQHECACRRR